MTVISTDVVRALVQDQFPRWGDLPVTPVETQGWDNRTYRLGDDLAVRLPSAEGYVPAVEKEDRCLPVLAGALPLPVPETVATGRPGHGYPFPWSVRRWIPGDTVEAAPDVDRTGLARDLGAFLTALRKIPDTGGPAAGRHSYFRGCHPSAYGDQVESALDRLGDEVDRAACEAVWARALVSAWPCAPTWFHGDVAVGNLLVADGRLSAVIDFGTCGVGDPACDLVMAWTYFRGGERKAFRESAGLSEDTWHRARGWALWKALVIKAGRTGPDLKSFHSRVLLEVLQDPVVG